MCRLLNRKFRSGFFKLCISIFFRLTYHITNPNRNTIIFTLYIKLETATAQL